MHEYKDEIRVLKEQHADEIADLISSNNSLIEEKDAEISELISNAESAELRHIDELTEITEQLEYAEEKAHNWDLIDTALSQKTVVNFQLWNGGTAPFELPMLNLPLVTSFSGTYISTLITKIGMNIPSATNISEAFNNKSRLKEVILKNTDRLVNISNTFSYSASLQYVDLGTIRSCTDMSYAFRYCTSLKKIKVRNADNIKSLTYTFSQCQSLEEIDGTLNPSQCTSFNDTFGSCGNLRTIRFAENSIRANIDFGACPNLSKESVYSIIRALSAENPAILRLSASVFSNTLTAEEADEIRSAAAEKNWTINS